MNADNKIDIHIGNLKSYFQNIFSDSVSPNEFQKNITSAVKKFEISCDNQQELGFQLNDSISAINQSNPNKCLGSDTERYF
jgi:hypothetical protein